MQLHKDIYWNITRNKLCLFSDSSYSVLSTLTSICKGQRWEKSSQKGIQSFQETFAIHTCLTIYRLLLISNIGFIMKINVWICHQTWQIFIVLFVDFFVIYCGYSSRGNNLALQLFAICSYYFYSLEIVEIINVLILWIRGWLKLGV